MSLHPSTRSWEISRKRVNIIKVIGKGAFSQVAQATVRNLRGSQESITVAVKMLKGMVLMCGHARIACFHSWNHRIEWQIHVFPLFVF